MFDIGLNVCISEINLISNKYKLDQNQRADWFLVSSLLVHLRRVLKG